MAALSPNLLAYARAPDPAAEHHALDLDLSAVFDTIQANLPNPHSRVAPPIPLPRDGKFQLKKSELLLVAASLRPPPLSSWDEVLPDPHRVRNLKVEVPLLIGHERDLCRFPRGPSLDSEGLGFFSDCTDPHTGLRELAKDWDAQLCQEKLQATKEDLTYLQRMLRDPFTPAEYEQVLKDTLPRYTGTPFLDQEERELEENRHLQDLQTESLPGSRKRPLPPPAPAMLRSPDQQFSATQSLLGFMRTRGDGSKRLKFRSHHFSEG